MEYIDKDKLTKALNDENALTLTVRMIIYHLPKEAVAPCKSARWEYTSGSPYILIGGKGQKYFCTHCGKRQDVKTSYCPDCGAKMGNP